MWKWLRTNWGKRKVGAMADLVYAVQHTNPDWKQIQIDRKSDGLGVVLSITGDEVCTVEPFTRVD